ncbi:MAG: 2-oxo acid dehydrogenase subunit E2 [Acidobacteriia bacterium]|nr:2-oxo acid dehydrogenase subunit E2 [Terriglobia bacterium]
MPTKVIMPQMGESIAEGTVVKWLKKVGERVERDEPLFEISTDKVDAEIPSPASGVLTQVLVKENETVAVNAVVAWIDGEGAGEAVATVPAASAVATTPPAAPAAAEPRADAEVEPPPAAGGKTRSSPLVRRIAQEHHVDLSQVKGTGLGGRISKKDILAHLSQAPAAAAIDFAGPTHVVAMTPMRRQIAEHMALSKRTSAHVSTVFEVEMTRIVEVMARSGEEFERRHGLKLTYTPFFVRAAVEAIKAFPIVNSSVEGTNIVYKRDVNMGIAVAIETGLIVPVIKHADEKSFLGIARAVKDLAERARTKHLNVDEVQEGTFTITNPGVFGGLFGTPIIPQPQVAILGVGAIEKRPVVRNDAIAIRSMVYLVLTFDHRIIDGAVADQFMARLKSGLENWDEAVL